MDKMIQRVKENTIDFRIVMRQLTQIKESHRLQRNGKTVTTPKGKPLSLLNNYLEVGEKQFMSGLEQ